MSTPGFPGVPMQSIGQVYNAKATAVADTVKHSVTVQVVLDISAVLENPLVKSSIVAGAVRVMIAQILQEHEATKTFPVLSTDVAYTNHEQMLNRMYNQQQTQTIDVQNNASVASSAINQFFNALTGKKP